MSSIDSSDIIRTLLKNDGVYPGDPRCQSVYQYENAWGGVTFKLCYTEYEEETFLIDGNYRSYACLFRDRALTHEGRIFTGELEK